MKVLAVFDHSGIETVVILSDLVGVLARSWDLDRAWPVGVHVAEGIGGVFKVFLGDIFGLVHGNEEVNWSDTSLSGLLRDQEEIEALILAFILNKVGVNDGSRRWIVILLAILDEHSLVDSLVDYDQSNRRNTWCRVVDWLKGLFELGDLLINDLVSHLLSDTISVNYDFSGRLTIAVLGEGIHCSR